jgi:hypothetical protein
MGEGLSPTSCRRIPKGMCRDTRRIYGPENDAATHCVSMDAVVAVVSRALVAWYASYVVSLLALVVLAAHLY